MPAFDFRQQMLGPWDTAKKYVQAQFDLIFANLASPQTFDLNVAGTTTLTGDATALAQLRYATSKVLSWNTKVVNVVYFAPSDGMVQALVAGTSATLYNVAGYTDGNSNPTTLRAACSISANGRYDCLTFPVKKGEYYTVSYGALGATDPTITVWWVPFGTSGA